MMPILVKSDDVRSVRKTKARHNQLQAAQESKSYCPFRVLASGFGPEAKTRRHPRLPLNVSLFKIRKLVVTIRKGHFMNSVFVNPGIYSCAVDDFLEISTHLFLPYLSNLRIRNEFTNPLFNVCSHYMSSREDSLILSEIRKPVWSYMINLCSSFTARDCNACFSQIFEKKNIWLP